MRYAVLTILAATGLAACAPVEPMPHPRPTPGACRAEAGQRFIGQPFRAGLENRIRRATRSATARVGRPGQPMTMDYRQDRVTIGLDGRDRVESVRCG